MAAKRGERLHLNPPSGFGDTRETGDSSEREFWFLGRERNQDTRDRKGDQEDCTLTRKVERSQGLRSNRRRGATGNGGSPELVSHHWPGQGARSSRP